MPTFSIRLYPAKRTDFGSIMIAVTNRIKTAEVDCKLPELREHMGKVAQGVKSPSADMPGLSISAYPVGRAPSGFNAFKAANQNEMFIEPDAVATQAAAATADAVD